MKSVFSNKIAALLRNHHVVVRSILLVVFSSIITSSFAQISGDYGAYISGSWTTASTWKIYNGVSWASSPVAGVSPSSTAISCYILPGSTVTFPSGASQTPCNNLVVNSTAKLYANSGGSNTYIYVYGNITCDGTIGNGAIFDAISFGIEGANCLITGTGVFDCSRIRKNLNVIPATNLVIDISITLRFGTGSQTQIYNSADASTFNVTLNAGKTLSLTGNAGIVGNVAMDGILGTDPSERAGSYLINGTLIISGFLYLTTNNNTTPCSFTIGTTGIVQTFSVIANVSGAATHTFTMLSGGLLQINGSPFTNPFTLTNNIYNLNPGSTIQYNSAGVQNVDNNLTYANLKLTGFNTASTTTTITGVMGNNTITVGSSALLATGMIVSGTGINPGAAIIAISGTTVTLSLSNTAAVSGTGTFTSTPSKNASGPIVVAGNLDIQIRAVFTPYASNAMVTVGGNWTNYGTGGFVETGSKVELNGSGTQTIACTGGEDFAILKINKGSGKAYLANLPATIARVSGTLDLTLGNMVSSPISGAYYVRIQNTASVINVSDNSFIEGTCVRELISGSPVNFTYPIGVDTLGLATYRPESISGTPTANSLMYGQYYKFDPNVVGNVTALDVGLDHLSRCEYWRLRLVGTATPQVYTVNLSWNSQTSCGVTQLSDLRVASWSNPTANLWNNLGNGSTSGNTAGGTITASVNSSFISSASGTPFTLASLTTENPLPVELLYFNAKAEKDVVLLHWATSSETNNDYFTVERSSDAEHFYEVARKDGFGNSSETHSYETTDLHPLRGVSYYRLKQWDYDGNFAYSNMDVVEFQGGSKYFVSVSPVPAHDFLNINCTDCSNAYTIEVLQSDGKLLKVFESSENFSKLDLNEFQQGVYFLRVVDGSETQGLRFIKE